MRVVRLKGKKIWFQNFRCLTAIPNNMKWFGSIARGYNLEPEPKHSPTLHASSFWQLLLRHRCQAISVNALLLVNNCGIERCDLQNKHMPNFHKQIYSRLRSEEDILVSPHPPSTGKKNRCLSAASWIKRSTYHRPTHRSFTILYIGNGVIMLR